MTKIILLLKILFIKLNTKSKFIIKIEDGVVTKISGNVNNSFFNDCIEIANRNGLKKGIIYAYQSNFGTKILKITNEIESKSQQQLRNSWNFYN